MKPAISTMLTIVILNIDYWEFNSLEGVMAGIAIYIVTMATVYKAEEVIRWIITKLSRMHKRSFRRCRN